MGSIMSYSLICVLTATANLTSDNHWWIVLAGIMEYVPAFTLTPRLILGLRALYARDLQCRSGRDIDTAFGLISTSGHDVAVGTVVFLDTGRNDGEGQREVQDEIQMKDMEIRTIGSGS